MNSSFGQAIHLRVIPSSPSDDQLTSDELGLDRSVEVARRSWGDRFEAACWWLIVGVELAVTLVVTFLILDLVDGNLSSVATGQVPLLQHVEFRSAVIVALFTVAILASDSFEEAASRRDLGCLQRLFPATRFEQIRSRVETVDPNRRGRAGLLGALLCVASVPTLYAEPARFLHLETYALLSVLFDFAMAGVLGWICATTLFASLAQDRSFAALPAELERIDLCDLMPLNCFTRRGLRRALRWLVLALLASVAFVDADRVEPQVFVLVAFIGLALFSFALPVYGIHRRIRIEKRRALTALRKAICSERGSARLADVTSGPLADLHAAEARIASCREWAPLFSHRSAE